MRKLQIALKNAIFFYLSIISMTTNVYADTGLYIDSELLDFKIQVDHSDTYHLFSHGKPGHLFIENKWLDADAIVNWLKANVQENKYPYLNIYGCSFGKGAIGLKAVQVIESSLDIVVSASNDLTGIDGDWTLEIGRHYSLEGMEGYKGNLQCDCIDYLYVNDPNLDLTHKFAINSDGTVGDEVFSSGAIPWLAPNVLENAHGVVADANGELYIAQIDTDPTALHKVSCEGDIISTDYIPNWNRTLNLLTIGNTIYSVGRAASGGPYTIFSHDLCSGDLIASISTPAAANSGLSFTWGMSLGADGNIYFSGTWGTTTDEHCIYKVEKDLSSFEEMVCLPNVANYESLGLDQDECGNFYLSTRNRTTGGTIIYKVDSDGVLIDSIEDAAPDESGFANGWGITYNKGRLYVGTLGDDCVAVINTGGCDGNMQYLSAAGVGHVPGTYSKAINIVTECCPESVNETISRTYCLTGGEESINLNDLFPCDGVICSSKWEPQNAASQNIFSECDQTINIDADAEGCFGFSKTSNTSAQCGSYNLTFELEIIEAHPVTISGQQSICSGNAPGMLVAATSGNPSSYQWQSSSTSCDSGFENINNANSSSYQPGILSSTTYYRLLSTYVPVFDCIDGFCQDTSNCLIVTVVDLPSLTCSESDNTNCINPNGEVTVTTDASSPSFVWTNDAGIIVGNKSVVSDLEAGLYTVDVTDGDTGCVASCSITVSNSTTNVSCDFESVVQPSCDDLSGGSAVVRILEGNGPFEYAWNHDPSLSLNTLTGVEGGNYTVTVTDANFCTSSCTVSIDVVECCETLGGEVFFDNDRNGCQNDLDEIGVVGVNVLLFDCEATDLSVDNALAQDITNSEGQYIFGPEESGEAEYCLDRDKSYFVLFDLPNSDNELYADYYWTDGDGSTCTNSDIADDLPADTNQSDCYDPENDDPEDDDEDEDIDAGIMPCEELAGEVFYDWNKDGCQDSFTELGVEGVSVYLYSCSELNPTAVNSLAQASTDINGGYTFGYAENGDAQICLHADSSYYVQFELPDEEGEALEGFYFTPGDGQLCSDDPDSDDVSSFTGRSDCYDPENDDLEDDDHDEDIDAGITPCEELAGEVFYDWDRDGCQDANAEIGVEGVSVYLYSCSELNPTNSNSLAQTMTDSDGKYAFGYEEKADARICLHPDSTYFVKFGLPNSSGEALDGFVFTEETTMACFNDEDGDDVSSTTGQSDCYDPEEDDDDQDIDAGIVPCEELGGEVFYDWDMNGCQDQDIETGVDEVVVYLYSCSQDNPTPSNALAQDLTGKDGEYKFGVDEEGTANICLYRDSSYYVLFDLPNGLAELYEGFAFSEGDGSTCQNSANSDDIDPQLATSDCYDPEDDDDDEDVDAGIFKCEELGGEVFYDENNDGCQDIDEPSFAEGIQVDLFECDDNGEVIEPPVASTTTDSLGQYRFGPMEVGDGQICLLPVKKYTVVFNLPNAAGEPYEGYLFSQGDEKCDTTDDASDVIGQSGKTDCFDPREDDDDEDIDAGIVLFDLALNKKTNDGPVILYGDTISYIIEIFNQGMVTATKIEVTDYLKDDFIFPADLNPLWNLNNGELDYLVEGPLEPNASIAIELKLIINPVVAEPGFIDNYAEITNALDGNGDPQKDIDSKPDDDEFNDPGGIPHSEDDDEIMDNAFEGGDEDDHDPERILLVECHDLACIGNINLSLDNNCTAEITGAMLLEYAPNDPDLYEITITDDAGNVVNNLFDFTQIGTCYNVSVGLPDCDANTCWSRVCIEDKFAPTIDCGLTQEVFACSAAVADLSAVTPPVITDNCGGASLVLVNEVITINDDCDPDDLLATVVRSYKAVDAQGNESAVCDQTIEVKRVVSGSIVFPADFTSNVCTTSTDISVTGVPTIGGVSIYPINQSATCNLMVSYVDLPVGEDNCHKIFVRTWTIREWWCGSVTAPITYGQRIEINDQTAPTINCPSDMTVTTDGGFGDCIATFTLPAATVSDDCNAPVEVDIETGVAFIDGNGGTASLEVGTHTIKYIAYDGCYNSSECTMTVTVRDETQPTILCEQNTVVSLQSTGTVEVFAETFDDGSFDDCALDRFEVRRMEDSTFGESVVFDCSDVGADVMVVMRVYDLSGNHNECMVSVEVQDKNVATINCLANVNLSCPAVYDLNNLAGQFGMPTVSGTCSSNIVITESAPVVNIDNCGVGTIRRRFTAPDGVGGTLACTQVIRIVNDDPIDVNDIVWPLDFSTTSMCDFTDATPDNLAGIYGYPVISEDVCDLVGVDFADQEFTFANDPSACFKILRTWTVIDWCQRNTDGTYITWSHVQEIKINNDTDPTIDSGLNNIVVESNDVNCSGVFVTLGITASDDCPSNMPLNYSYEIDLNSDGTTDQTGRAVMRVEAIRSGYTVSTGSY